jgi:hypothetical protein
MESKMVKVKYLKCSLKNERMEKGKIMYKEEDLLI